MSTRTALLTGAALLLLAISGAAEERGEIREDGDGWVETIDQVIDVDAGGTLVLRTDRGGIEVESWGKKGVRVTVEKKADVFTEEEARRVFDDYRIEVERDGNDVRVTAKSQSRRRTRSLGLSIKVVVPKPYSVDVETGSGGITIDDLEGNARARTSGGGISVGRIRNGSVDVHTSGGGITIERIENGDGRAVTSGGGISVGDVTGNLVVKTSGGGLNIGEVGGDLVAETSGGGISIEAGGGKVIAETGGGSVSIDGSKGPVDARTGGGSISIEGAEGPVKAETGGGGISVEGSGGPVVAKTGGGSISVDGSGGPVVVKTGGGSISIEEARGYIEAKTGGGSITADLVLDDPEVDTHCALETGSGDITIRLPAELQATIDAELRLKRPKRTYTITSDFPLEIEGDPDSSDRLTARGTINGGGHLIRLRTTNGDVRIEKR